MHHACTCTCRFKKFSKDKGRDALPMDHLEGCNWFRIPYQLVFILLADNLESTDENSTFWQSVLGRVESYHPAPEIIGTVNYCTFMLISEFL